MTKKIFILTLEDDAKSRELLSELLMRGFSVKPYIAPKPAEIASVVSPDQAKAMAHSLMYGDKVLVKDQADPEMNGVATVRTLNKDGSVRMPKIKLVNGKGIYENFVEWVGSRSAFTEASMRMWFAKLEEKCADGTVRRFNSHSFSTLKHELTKSGLMVCHDGKCLVDPDVLAATTGQEMRLKVEQIRKSQS